MAAPSLGRSVFSQCSPPGMGSFVSTMSAQVDPAKESWSQRGVGASCRESNTLPSGSGSW
jgi:hypothetical protein